MGCLAEAYIEETELFYLKEDYFDMCTAEKALDAKAYFAWLDAAEDARNQYRAGTLTQAEALRIIDC